MEKSRRYYAAQGYEKDYVWAHFDAVPFFRPGKSVADSRVTLITTAMPAGSTASGVKKVCSGAMAEPPDTFFSGELFWDREATHLDDLDSYFPIHHLRDFVDEGRIGSLSTQYHCVPTEYSQRRTNDIDGPEILGLCQRDRVDIALFVPL